MGTNDEVLDTTKTTERAFLINPFLQTSHTLVHFEHGITFESQKQVSPSLHYKMGRQMGAR